MSTPPSNDVFVKSIALAALIAVSFLHTATSQEIVIDPNQTGADDVVMYIPDIFITIPLPDPIPVPFDTGANELWIGNEADGSLGVTGGAQVTTPKAVLGVEPSTHGELEVLGANTLFSALELKVGELGDGTLIVGDGAVVEGDTLIIANESNAGEVSVTGPNTILSASSRIDMGSDFSSATLSVSNGATLSSDFLIQVRSSVASDTQLSIVGEGSRLDGPDAQLFVEDTFVVFDGAEAELDDINAGGHDRALIHIDGENTTLEAQNLFVGDQGIESRDARLVVSNGAYVDTRAVFVGRTSQSFDNGRVVVNGGTLRIENFINQMPYSVAFAGGTLVFGGDRSYTAGIDVTGFGILLAERGGALTNDETLRIEGHLAIEAPITIVDATLSAGSMTGISSLNFVAGRIELLEMPLEVSAASDIGTFLAVVEDQEWQVLPGIHIAAESLLSLDGGIVETTSLTNVGEIELAAGSFSQLWGDLASEFGSQTTIEIGLNGPGQVNIFGNAMLDGDLEISLQNGFVPSSSTDYVVMLASQLSGHFQNVQSGERLTAGNGSFMVYYGASSPYGSNQIVLRDYQAGVLLGDVNSDGIVNLLDVVPFVDAIASGDFIAAADINQDGAVDLLDVQAFVELLGG